MTQQLVASRQAIGGSDTITHAHPHVRPKDPRALLSAVALAGIAVGFLRVLRQPLTDPDTWWHLRAGEYLTQTHQLVGPEPWVRFSSRPWVLHEWLPELVVSQLARLGGLPAVAWLYYAGLLAVVFTLFVVCRRQAALLPATLATVAGMLGMSASLSMRPQLVTFVLIAVVTGTWLQVSEDLRPRWWLVPLSWLWACSHGMWFTGPLVGIAVVVALLAERRLSGRQSLRLLSVPLLSVVVAGLTPAGPSLLSAPLSVNTYARYVTEWTAPSIQSMPPAVTVGMAALVVLVGLRTGRRMPLPQLAILALGVGWALLYARTVAVGAAMLAPLFAMSLHSVLPQSARGASFRERRALAVGVASCLGLAAVLACSSPTQPGNVPNALDPELDQLPSRTVILNDYVLGGWILWRHRQLVPVVDGRTEVYDPAYLDAYGRAVSASDGWEGFLGRTGATYALLTAHSPIATALTERLNWSVLGQDDGYVLLHSTAVGPLRPTSS